MRAGKEFDLYLTILLQMIATHPHLDEDVIAIKAKRMAKAMLDVARHEGWRYSTDKARESTILPKNSTSTVHKLPPPLK